VNEADLLVVFGASFSNHTGIASYQPIIQVDFDPQALGRFHGVELPILAHVGVAARELLAELPASGDWIDQRAEVAERRRIWREEKASRVADMAGNGIASAAIFAALSECLPGDAVICVDVGNNTYSFGRYFESRNQSVLMSGYLGSIGFGFPAAMGAWAAVGAERAVISISGDGGFGQYAMELTTAVQYEMNITHVLLNNSELAKITKEQTSASYDVWKTALHNPSFAAFAELCGARGIEVTEPGQLAPAVAEALSYPGPALVEVIADPLLV
jgi:pyruvate oxidase